MTDLTLFTSGTAPPAGAATTGVAARTCNGARSAVSGETVAHAVDLLDALMVTLRSLGGDWIEERLGLVGRCEARLASVKSETVAELARRDGEARAAEAVRARLRQSRGGAKRDVKLAGQLAELPETAEALADGVITPQHTRMIVDAAEHIPVDEAELLAAAERYADALELLFTRTGSGKAQSTTLLVIADYDAVAGHLRDSRLADGTPLSADELMELALEAEILPALFDTAGQPLWLGREQRDASTAQRIVLAASDRGCVGCGAPNSFCRPHHIQYWENDGPTDLDNLCLLCSDCHHKQVHTNGARIVQGTDGKYALKHRRKDSVTTPHHVRNGADQSTRSTNVGSTVEYPLRL